MTAADYTLVFDKLRETTETETETARIQLSMPDADDAGIEEMREINELQRMAEELAEPETSTFTGA